MPLIATTHPDISRILERIGLQVLETADPDDAAQRADLVVVPFVNRPISGPAWCRALRERSDTLPILVITRSDDEVADALDAGASDILRHPLRDEIVDARVAGWLAVGRAHAAATHAEDPGEMPARVIEALPVPMLVTDTDGLILHINRAATHLTGFTATEAVGGLNLAELYASHTEGERLLQELRRSRGQVVLDRSAETRTREGERVPVRISAGLVLSARGRVNGIVVLMQDDRQNAELAQRLATSTERLVESERRAADARANAESIRELNQPLTTAMGLLEMVMLRPSLGQESRERLDRAYVQLERIAELIRQLSRAPAPPTR
ncbi:MAG: PAS domain-containing protein [Alphaproteobacteria bacterium]|nr:PAS domain-containing protein [Alphaproteobacteria bacterium]MCB9792937.1 PAS domain-containing protein [Alphaproteobacteria bacterium]